MRYNRLGHTGLMVSELCLGAMTFGRGEGFYSQIGQLGQEDTDRTMAAAIHAGVNFIDTANVYGGGTSEEVVGQAIRNLGIVRHDVVIATKAFAPVGEGPNSRGNSRHHLIESCKSSLARMKLDHIDLYQLHGFDTLTPIEETLSALDDLVRQGHVRYIGISNWAAWQVAKALGVSARLELERFASVQAYYSLVGRDLEREIAPMALSEQMGVMVWSPLAGGFLSGKYRARQDGEASRRDSFAFPPVDPARGDTVLDALEPIAAARGVSCAQAALAWLIHQTVVTSVIIGGRTIEQIEGNLAATKISFTAEELAALDEASRLPTEYPGWMLDRQRAYRAPGYADKA